MTAQKSSLSVVGNGSQAPAQSQSPIGMEVNVTHNADAYRWLLDELGTRGLAGIFKRDGKVVYTPRVDEQGYIPLTDDELRESERGSVSAAQVQPVNAFTMMAKIGEHYTPYMNNKQGVKAKFPEFPQVVCNMVLNSPDSAINLRPLLGVTHVPMPRKDGTILSQPGYDDASGYLYLPTLDVHGINENPSRQEVDEAVKLLRGMIADFAWLGEHDEANYLGLLLTPLLRQIAPPPYKFGVIMARQPGSGKTYLAQILRIIHEGEFRTSMPEGDTELGKQITGILNYTTAPVITWDNVTGQVKSPLLDGLLTTDRYSDRSLGSTNNTGLTNDRLWTMTGNNANLGGDLRRRAIWVTIDPKVPNPEQRTDFAIPDLIGYVQAHRADILRALLTLIANWRQHGMPCQIKSSDSYGYWSAVVREILSLAGIPGEFDAEESKQESHGSDSDEWEQLLTYIAENIGTGPENSFTVGQILTDRKLASTIEDVLPGDLAERASKMGGLLKPLSRSLGRWFSNHNGRWAGKYAARDNGRDKAKNTRWYIDTAE